jgi:hypothetical protein
MRGRLPEAVTAERKRIFWVPPRREDAILAGEACRAVLAMGAVRAAGLFDHRKIALARGLLKVVPGATRIGMALRLLLIAAASAQLVHHLFIERFADSRRRFACRDRRWTLEDLARQPRQGVTATV